MKRFKIFLYIFFLIVFSYLVFEAYKVYKKTIVKLEMYKVLKLKNYNQKLIPETQYLKVNLKKINIKDSYNNDEVKFSSERQRFDPNKKFFIEIWKNNAFLILSNGDSYYYEIDKLIKSKKVKRIKISNNLDTSTSKLGILGSHIYHNDIYISYAKMDKKIKNCYYMSILKSKINIKKLLFEEIFTTSKCDNESLSNFGGGRMQFIEINNNKKLLITTSDYSGKHSQDLNSPYGKILEIDLNKNEYEIFSLGHRNPQGLLVLKNGIILSTEHGPIGGDEVNKILKGSNYGWKVSSYGEPYFKFSIDNDFSLLKNHKKNDFVEPVYAFTPSIGISELINVDESFSNKWRKNILISSLNGRSIYRAIFDSEYEKIITKEHIFIGERIRDISFVKKYNIFLLALEDTGSIGILSKQNN